MKTLFALATLLAFSFAASAQGVRNTSGYNPLRDDLQRDSVGGVLDPVVIKLTLDLPDNGTNGLRIVKMNPDGTSKAVVLPTGRNQVTMETSTDLVNWSPATNGVYSSPGTVRFFRINMVKLP